MPRQRAPIKRATTRATRAIYHRHSSAIITPAASDRCKSIPLAADPFATCSVNASTCNENTVTTQGGDATRPGRAGTRRLGSGHCTRATPCAGAACRHQWQQQRERVEPRHAGQQPRWLRTRQAQLGSWDGQEKIGRRGGGPAARGERRNVRSVGAEPATATEGGRAKSLATCRSARHRMSACCSALSRFFPPVLLRTAVVVEGHGGRTPRSKLPSRLPKGRGSVRMHALMSLDFDSLTCDLRWICPVSS